MSNQSSLEGGSQPPPPLNLSGSGLPPPPPPPLNLSGGGLPPPPLNFLDKFAYKPPPPVNLFSVSRSHSNSSNNFKAFLKAQILAEEEGTAFDPNFTTSPSLNFEQKEEWETERERIETEARNATDIINPNKKIKFEEKPILYSYPPESSVGDSHSEGGGNVTKNN